MSAADGAVILQEVQQMRHLLKIRRHVRIVTAQMDVIKRQKNNALDLVALRLKMTGRLNRHGFGRLSGGRERNGSARDQRRRQ
jgi:hypothetical protein